MYNNLKCTVIMQLVKGVIGNKQGAMYHQSNP